MKRFVCWVLVLAGLCCFTVPAFAEQELSSVSVEVDGEKLASEAYMVDGRTMVPLRAIFERLNAVVEWDDATRSVTAVKETTTIRLAIDKTEAKVGEKEVTLDVPPLLIHGSTFVPLRFVSEALGAQVSFDSETVTAKVHTNSGCGLPGGQVHSGTIRSGGETWGVCGSPHFVKGDFYVEGADSPVLTIEAGAVVRFEHDGSLNIGESAPGGLVVAGTSDKPVVLTADSAGARAGFWKGIRFYELTVRGQASIEGARIEYAGGQEGAVYLQSSGQLLEVTLKHSEWMNNAFAGIHMSGNSRLSERSGSLTVTGTKAATTGGGFPVVAGTVGSHMLPQGTYTGNDVDAVRVTSNYMNDSIVTSTTWSYIGVPYEPDITITVEGAANPTLTIEPGVVTQWALDCSLILGGNDLGGLLAAGTKDRPVVFTSKTKRPGGWSGILFSASTDKSNNKVENAVVEYAGNGISFAADLGPIVTGSVIRNNKEHGIYMQNGEPGSTDFRSGRGNKFEGNGMDQNVE